MTAASSDPSDLYGGCDPREIATYSFSDAARYLHVPSSTVAAWSRGQRSFPAVIGAAAERSPQLSFNNLIELHMLSSLRRDENVSLQRIRRAVEFLTEKLRYSRPLLRARLLVDQKDIYVVHLGQLICASEAGQMIIRELWESHLSRIEQDDRGLARRLFPFARRGEDLSQPKSVMVDPWLAFGRPVIAGTSIRTEIVLERYLAGESPKDLSEDYDCELDLIEDAIRCEYIGAVA